MKKINLHELFIEELKDLVADIQESETRIRELEDDLNEENQKLMALRKELVRMKERI